MSDFNEDRADFAAKDTAHGGNLLTEHESLCLWCQKEMLTTFYAEFCSDECRRAYYGQRRAERKHANSRRIV